MFASNQTTYIVLRFLIGKVNGRLKYNEPNQRSIEQTQPARTISYGGYITSALSAV